MNLVIVESPAKAKTINKYLGKEYKVLASYGHIRDLPSKNGSVDPENNFQMLWEVDSFSKKYLKEIKDWVVCPTCLAEKPMQQTIRMEIAGWEVFFCRCPHCPEVFQKDPDHYVKRLQAEIPYNGIFGQAGCGSTKK